MFARVSAFSVVAVSALLAAATTTVTVAVRFASLIDVLATAKQLHVIDRTTPTQLPFLPTSAPQALFNAATRLSR